MSSNSMLSLGRNCLEYGKRHLRIFRILLDVVIWVYVLLIPVILFTGGFKFCFIGFTIKATHLEGHVFVLLALILIRAAILLEKKNFLLLVASLFISLTATEILLRIHPLLLGDLFANKVLSKYHTAYDGIYEYDPIVKMNFMKHGKVFLRKMLEEIKDLKKFFIFR